MVRQRLHELTDRGIKSAKDWLAILREGRDIPFPTHILTDMQYARPVNPAIYVEDRNFRTRGEAGIYLTRKLASLGETRVIGNVYLWSWLGMFYFNRIVRKDADDNPILNATDIPYVMDPRPSKQSYGENRRFANRLMLAYDIYRQHGENAWIMIDEPVNSLSHFTMRLASAPELFRSKGIVHLAHLLYGDMKTRKLKPNYRGESVATAPPGSLPRLIAVLNQLYMTYDVYGMTAKHLMPLLPPEFDRFKPATGLGRDSISTP